MIRVFLVLMSVLVMSPGYLSAAQTGSSKVCDVVNVKVPQEGLKQISNMPDGTIFYMSKTNRFESLSEVKDGEFGVWGTDMQYHLAVNVKFDRPTPWDHGSGIGGAYWKELFKSRPKLKLFVTQTKYKLHKVICETGGGARIKFVTE